MTEKHEGGTTGAAKLLQACERPIFIGFIVGLLAGLVNSAILSIPLWISLTSGVILGVLITLIACPGMRTALKERREAHSLQMKRISNYKSSNAFTAID